MKIEMGKKYRTKDGRSVRILCTDLIDDIFTVVAAVKDNDEEYVERYTNDGRYWSCEKSHRDLVEVTEWDDFKVDEPVMVRDSEDTPWMQFHFAGVSDNGVPTVFAGGATSWSSSPDFCLYFRHCRRPTEEELQKCNS